MHSSWGHVFCALPLPHTLKHAQAKRERVRGAISDNASTDGYIHKVVKIPVLASVLVKTEPLCLKLTYTAEKEHAEQLFPA